MKIKVTQEHIDKGSRCVPGKCPVALAIKATGFPYVSVGVERFYLESDGEAIPLPATATHFICLFDTDKSVEPFEFEINTEEAPTKVHPIENLRIG